MSYADKQVTCHDCGTVFTFGIKEQQQFASMGRFNAPKRCETCRAKRKPAKSKLKVLFQSTLISEPPPEGRMRQNVPPAERTLKFLLNHSLAGRFIVTIVSVK